MPPILTNKGRQINFLTGITGVAAGGQAIVNLPVNQRYHRIILNTTSAGSAAAVTTIIASVKLIVNGVPIRDIDPINIMRICWAQGYYPLLGELPIFFTEPFNTSGNINEPADVTSWDMAGQSTFQLQIGIQVGAVTPGITGIVEFDYQRNMMPSASGMVPFLQPVSHHQFSLPVVIGANDITTLPFSFPIRRLWFQGSTPNSITQLEVYQDNNKIHEATNIQTRQAYRQYGFRLFAAAGAVNVPEGTVFRNATGPADLALSALVETASFFDVAYLSDPDGRWWKALKCGQTFQLRITSSAAQTLTTIMETMPGAFIG